MNHTEELARYALELDPTQVSPEALAMAQTVFADTVGVLLAASQQRAVTTAMRALTPSGGECTVLGHTRGATPEQAAFINGTGGHDIELDDLHTASRTHAAAVVVPAAIAAVETAGDCRGDELLTALVVAYDVQIRVMQAIGPQRSILRGFHPSAIGGPVGAAVVAGRLLGLDVGQLRNALALAASQASGLQTYQDDTAHMIKSFQTGVAARNGLYAALLAREGYEGAPDVLTGEHTMLEPFGGPEPNVSALLDGLGERFEILQTSLKRFACCGHIHSSLDALLELCADHDLGPDDIIGIDVKLAHDAVPIIDANPLWTHNLQYCMAVAAHDGTVAIEHFGSGWTSNAEVLDLASRVLLTGDDDIQEHFPEWWGTKVAITTADGIVDTFRSAPKGSPRQPLTAEELRTKFDHLAATALDPRQTARLWERLADIGNAPGVNGVLELLIPSATSAAASR